MNDDRHSRSESLPAPLRPFPRALLLAAGTLALALGIVGAFVPVLPTTPFVLLAAFCYIRSSARMYRWLMKSRLAGDHVHNVLSGKGVPLGVKVFSLAVSALMIGYVSIVVTENFWVRMLLGVLYLVQFVFMVRIPTLKATPQRPDAEGELFSHGGR